MAADKGRERKRARRDMVKNEKNQMNATERERDQILLKRPSGPRHATPRPVSSVDIGCDRQSVDCTLRRPMQCGITTQIQTHNSLDVVVVVVAVALAAIALHGHST